MERTKLLQEIRMSRSRTMANRLRDCTQLEAVLARLGEAAGLG